MTTTLEKIFYKNEKFVDSKGNKIKPKPVGNPMMIIYKSGQNIKKNFTQKHQTFIKNHKINAYLLGQSYGNYESLNNEPEYYMPLQFYKK